MDRRLSSVYDDDSIDDIDNTLRRISFAAAKNSQELIACHMDNGLGSQIRRGFTSLLFGPLHIRLCFSLTVACSLAFFCYQQQRPERKEEVMDLCAFCLIYGTWLAMSMPMLLVTINVRLTSQVLQALFRLFFAEVAVMVYAYYRGHNNVLRRGFGLFPTLEANRPGRGLAWLGEAGYNLRLASLISCFLIATVVTATEVWINRSIE